VTAGPVVPERAGTSRRGAWHEPYRPLRPRGLLAQLAVLVVAEVALFRSYGTFDSSFHWAAHFLVGVIGASVFLSAWLLVASAPARFQVVVLLLFHLYAMFPDLLFRAGVPHSPWMNVFLGHIAVHYIWGGDRTWLVLALAAYGGYAVLLSLWLRARTVEADRGQAPGVGIGGAAVVRPQHDPAATRLGHVHDGPVDGAGTAPGTVVVLLHGLGATGTVWGPVAGELARLGYASMRPDLLGFGSSLRIGTRFGHREQADAVARLIDAHAYAHVRLVGHSYGCVVAVELARSRPGTVESVVLVNPPAFPDVGAARERLSSRSWLARRTLRGAPVASAACGLMCLGRAPLGRLAPRVRPDLPGAVVRAGLQHSFPAYRDAVGSVFGDNPVAGWFRSPSLPTRVVLAAGDRTFSAAAALAVPAGIGVILETVPGTHLLPLERPDWLAAVLAPHGPGRTA